MDFLMRREMDDLLYYAPRCTIRRYIGEICDDTYNEGLSVAVCCGVVEMTQGS